MPNPIDLTINAPFLRPFELGLAVVGLDPTSNDPQMLGACVQHLTQRCDLAEADAWRIVEALRELAAR